MQSEDKELVKLEIEDTVSFYRRLLKEDIILLRKGDFSHETILPLFKLFESNLQLKKENLVFKKKSLYILIELLQNMNKHALEINGSKEGLFIISLKDSVYTMRTGNYINKEKRDYLKKHLESLVGLDKIELSKRYKQQLMSPDEGDGQGAGLGIIETIRQCEGEISYDFNDIDENLCFFSFSATL